MNDNFPHGTIICQHCCSSVCGKLDTIICESCGKLYWSMEIVEKQLKGYMNFRTNILQRIDNLINKGDKDGN